MRFTATKLTICVMAALLPAAAALHYLKSSKDEGAQRAPSWTSPLASSGSVGTGIHFSGTGFNEQTRIQSYSVQAATSQNITLNSWASIAQIDDSHIAIANYNSVIVLDENTSTLCKAATKWQIPEAKWNPTGIFYTADKIYIANYKGNNILVGSISGKDCEITISQELKDNDSLGPENIFVDSHNNVFSANYDSGTVVAFDSNGKKTWSAKVPQAHGITADENYVYATSLTNRSIQKLDKKSGALILEVGKLGWSLENNEYLWPTSLMLDSNGNIIVSDAQSGMVGLLDKTNLKAITSFGGMGPGLNFFNYPYSATLNDSNELLVTSSMRASIYVYDANSLKLKRIIAPDDQQWNPRESYAKYRLGTGWTGYVDTNGSISHLFGKDVVPAFGALYSQDASSIIFNVPDLDEAIWTAKPYLYFLQTAQIGRDTLIFSASSSDALLYSEQLPQGMLVPIKLESRDIWAIGDRVVSNGQALNQESIHQQKLEFLKKIEAATDRKIPSTQSIMELYGTTDSAVLDSSFKSPSGKTFNTFWKYCQQSNNCKKSDLEQMAVSYLLSTRNQAGISLGEISLVSMISGKNWNSLPSIKLESCGTGKYYKGYAPEDAKPGNLSSYISAVDIQSSELCATGNQTKLDGALRIYWLNKDEIPAAVTISSLSKGKVVGKSSYAISQDNIKTDSTQGIPYSTLALPKEKSAQYLIKISTGGKQNRLLIRNIELIPGKQVKIGALDTPDRNLYGTKAIPSSAKRAHLKLLGARIGDEDVFHCGHYATRYIYENRGDLEWRMYDLQNGEAIHTVVEVKSGNSWKIKDPTLGYTLDCSLSEVGSGACQPDQSSLSNKQRWDERFNAYAPENFLPNAEIRTMIWGNGHTTRSQISSF